jgi:hypothetical protein
MLMVDGRPGITAWSMWTLDNSKNLSNSQNGQEKSLMNNQYRLATIGKIYYVYNSSSFWVCSYTNSKIYQSETHEKMQVRPVILASSWDTLIHKKGVWQNSICILQMRSYLLSYYR